MRFKPHDRIIDLLVGQRLYTSADTALRELLQNAEDACALQLIKDAAYEPNIVVRYSPSQNIVEIRDDGLGMNEEAIENSFASIGAPKTEVSHIRDLLTNAGERGHQIAQFGIGILSCFGVADSVTVHTKMDDHPGFAFKILNFHEEFETLANSPNERGTRISLLLKPSGPMHIDHVPAAVKRYARHAAHVEIENIDTGERQAIPELWHGADLLGAEQIEDPAMRKGILALDPAWDNPSAAFSSGLVMCNGGFLVKERELHLLPQQALGYRGELDIKPGALTILINREGFQQDSPWQELGQRLSVHYSRLLRAKIDEWEMIARERHREIESRGIDRSILILARGPSRGILEQDLGTRLDRLIPQIVHIRLWDSNRLASIIRIIEDAKEKGVIYYKRDDEGIQQFQQSLQQGTGSVQVTETAQTQDLRAMHLRAKGAVVLVCRPRNYAAEFGGQNQNIAVHEADLMAQACQEAGIRWVAVNAATPEEVELGVTEESALLSSLLGLGEELRFVVLNTLQDRVIRDYAGRLLNCANPEVQEILRILPDAVGNPLRRVLLQIYMDINNYQLDSARRQIKQLLVAPDLAEQAQLTTGRLLRDYLRRRLRVLAGDGERPR